MTATGTGLSYQWYQGTRVTTTTPVGTNSANFTTPALTATWNYWVRVSNSGGSIDSNTATVTVIAPPVITTPPNGSTLPGSTVPFTWKHKVEA